MRTLTNLLALLFLGIGSALCLLMFGGSEPQSPSFEPESVNPAQAVDVEQRPVQLEQPANELE